MADQLHGSPDEPSTLPVGIPWVPAWESAPGDPPEAPVASPDAPSRRRKAGTLLSSLAVVGGLVLITAPFVLAGIGGAGLFTAAPASPVTQFHSPSATTIATTSPAATSSSPATTSDSASSSPFTAPPAAAADQPNGAGFTPPAATKADQPNGAGFTPPAVVGPTGSNPTLGGLTPSGPTSSWSAYGTFKAVDYSAQSGRLTPETCSDTGKGQDIGSIAGGTWAKYPGINFGSTPATQFYGRAASGAGNGVSGLVEVRLDSLSAAPIGSFAIANTGGWQSWRTVPANISPTTGTHTVYLTFTSGQPAPFVSLNWFNFGH